MLLLERPNTFSTSVSQDKAIKTKKLTAKWVKVDQQLVMKWVAE